MLANDFAIPLPGWHCSNRRSPQTMGVLRQDRAGTPVTGDNKIYSMRARGVCAGSSTLRAGDLARQPEQRTDVGARATRRHEGAARAPGRRMAGVGCYFIHWPGIADSASPRYSRRSAASAQGRHRTPAGCRQPAKPPSPRRRAVIWPRRQAHNWPAWISGQLSQLRKLSGKW